MCEPVERSAERLLQQAAIMQQGAASAALAVHYYDTALEAH